MTSDPKQPGKAPPTKKSDDSEGEDGQKIRTQMIGEAPGEDLGYDPAQIPTEEIPDDD